MTLSKRNVTSNLSAVWTIAQKDIVDSIKNKVTLSILILVLFATLIYRMVPGLEAPRLLVYAPDESQFATELMESPELEVQQVASWEEAIHYLQNRDIVAIAVEMPPDIDSILASGAEVTLKGYIAHWISDSAALETKELFEQQLLNITGRAVHLNLEGNRIYTRKDSRGFAHLTATGLVFLLLMIGVGLVPYLMTEEKRTRTLDALLVYPISIGQIITGKALTGLFYCVVGASVVLVLNAGLVTQWPVAMLATIVGALFMVSLGLFLGSLVEGEQTLAVSWFLFAFLMLPVTIEAMLRDLLPEGAVKVVGLLPTSALSTVYRASFSNDPSLANYAMPLAVLIGSTVLVLVSTIWALGRINR